MSEHLNRREALAAALTLTVLPAVAVAADKPAEKLDDKTFAKP